MPAWTAAGVAHGHSHATDVSLVHDPGCDNLQDHRSAAELRQPGAVERVAQTDEHGARHPATRGA